jgi:hypothetical protein
MTEWVRGAKAGMVGGGAWGIITAIETAASTSPVGAAGPTILIVAILRVAWGLALGLVFAAVAERFLPARTYRAKGVAYGLILGIIELALNVGSLAAWGTDLAVNLAVGLTSSLAFGYILGYSFQRFATRAHPVIKQPGSSGKIELRLLNPTNRIVNSLFPTVSERKFW